MGDALQAPEAMQIDRGEAPAQKNKGGRPTNLEVAQRGMSGTSLPSNFFTARPRAPPPAALQKRKRDEDEHHPAPPLGPAEDAEPPPPPAPEVVPPEAPAPGAAPEPEPARALAKQRAEALDLIRHVTRLLEKVGVTIQEERDEAVGAINMARDEAGTKVMQLQGLLDARTSLQVLQHPHVALTGDGKVFCAVCTENLYAVGNDGRMLHSSWIASQGGYDTKHSNLVARWGEHYGSEMHKICCDAARIKRANPMGLAVDAAIARRDETTKRCLMISANADLDKRSFRSYERDLLLTHLLGTDVGESEHSRHTRAEMADSACRLGMNQMKSFATTTNSITHRLPHVGSSIDKQTDNGGKQSQMQMFRVNFNGTPCTIFGSLKMLTVGEYDEYDDENEEHEADGQHCFLKYCEGLDEIGVNLFVPKTRDEHGTVTVWGDPILDHGHHPQSRSVATDGEACYAGRGPLKSVRARLVGNHELGDASQEHVHDWAHCLDLLIDGAHKRNSYVVDVIHVTIKEIYAHYSASPHRYRHMKLVAEWGADNLYRELHYLFKVCFVESEHTAILNFLQSLPAIYASLDKELAGVLTPTMRIQIQGWKTKIRQFKFIAHLIVMIDLHKANKIFSKRVQSDTALILDVPTYIETFKQDLEKMKTSVGSEAEKRLTSLAEGKLVMVDADEDAESMLTVEDDEGRMTVVGVVDVAAATGDVKQRLLGYQREFVTSMLGDFDARIQMPRVALLLRKVFDFRRMPLSCSYEALLPWGDDELEELRNKYFPELDAHVLRDEALAMRMYVWENHKLYMRDGKLLLTGDGSIFQAFFSRSDVCTKPIPSILHVADYMIAFMWQSCNGERAASHINIVKSKERTGLGDEAFNAVVYNTINMPKLHEIDFDALLDQWIADGRKYATFKGALQEEETNSKVLRRLLAEKSEGKFLFKKR